MNSCRSAALPAQAGRIYRKVAYGPLLDVFLIDMRSYRDSTWNRRGDGNDACILGPTQLAWLKRELAASECDLESHRRRYADRTDQRRRDCAWRWPAGAARMRDRRFAVLHEAHRRQQHGLADGRHALYGRAPLRSEPRGIPGFRAVLGIRLRPAACRDLGRRRSWTIRSARRWRFKRAAALEQGENLAPCFGLQFFGRVDIDGRSEVMTVTLKDVDNRDLWSVRYRAAAGRPSRIECCRSTSDPADQAAGASNPRLARGRIARRFGTGHSPCPDGTGRCRSIASVSRPSCRKAIPQHRQNGLASLRVEPTR